MFNPADSLARWGFVASLATILLVSGCTPSSNPVGIRSDAVEDEIPIKIPEEALRALSTAPDLAKIGGAAVTYTFDDLGLRCLMNAEFPSVYMDLTFSDSRLLARCSFDGGVALVPSNLAKLNANAVTRTLISLPAPAVEVSIDAFGIRSYGPRHLVAYDAAGAEIGRATSSGTGVRVRLTVTGAIRQVGIIDYQTQTYWDNLTVTFGSSNNPPIADAGPDVEIIVGEAAVLDGTASTDPDGDDLAYAWSLTSAPAGSRAALFDASTAISSFKADLAGTYTAQLVVDDGTEAGAPDHVVIAALHPGDAVGSLAEDVSSLMAAGALSRSQAASLLKMLDFVRQKIDKQPQVALNKLGAFTGHVSGLVEDGILVQEQGEALIVYAQRIAEAITAPS